MTHQQLTFVFTIFACIIFYSAVRAQELTQSYLNSLDDEPLLTLFDTHDGDSTAQEKIARTYLDRARRQKDTIKMARGYDRLARTFHSEKNIAFADSIIEITKNVNHITYPAMGYLLKGHYYTDSNLVESTINFYKAYDYALLNDNTSQQLFLMNILIIRKAYWGNKFEALEMQRKNHKILFRENINDLLLKGTRKGYASNLKNFILQMKFNSNIAYTICFIENRKLDSALYYLNRAKLIHKKYIGYAKENQGVIILECQNEISYYQDNFTNSIKVANNIINSLEDSNEIASLYDAYLFKGKSLLKLKNEKESIETLLKADSIFNVGEIDVLPHRQTLFTVLLDYYQKNGNIKKQIEYHNKIHVTDSIMKANYSFYENFLKTNIETPTLLAEKEVVIDKLKKDNEAPDPKLYLSLAALAGSLCLLFYYVRKRLVYKKRFEALLAGKSHDVDKSLHEGEYRNELSADVVEDILEKLNRFERSHGYLQSDITLSKLAKRCKTNSNYLSRVINLKREKNFSQYLHELRIGYAVNELLSEAAYRKYTIKAIAEECGYNNAESFSKAFYKLHGIYPSYYIKKVEKSTG